jgi:hypothetical protein
MQRIENKRIAGGATMQPVENKRNANWALTAHEVKGMTETNPSSLKKKREQGSRSPRADFYRTNDNPKG